MVELGSGVGMRVGGVGADNGGDIVVSSGRNRLDDMITNMIVIKNLIKY